LAGSSVVLDEAELEPPLAAEPELGWAEPLLDSDFCSAGAGAALELALEEGWAELPPEAASDLPASMFTDVDELFELSAGAGAALELALEEGCAELPPEAAPDLPASMVTDVLDEPLGAAAEPPEGVAEELEDEPGAAGAAVPPEAELDEEPGAVDGDGVALSLRALELDEPGADDVRSGPLSPQAARPSARATATARVESFMCPPWLGYRTKQQIARPA
jgi:hypothetical protein